MRDDFKKIVIEGIKDCYLINTEGVIHNVKTNKYLKYNKNSRGYVQVQLAKTNGGIKSFVLSRLIAHVFIDGFDIHDKDLVVHHKDNENKTNVLELLEVCTQKDNIKYSIESGNRPLGEKHGNSTFTDELAIKIVELLKKKYSTNKIIKKLELENKSNLRIFINDLRAGRTRKYLTEGLDLKKIKQNRYDDKIILQIIKLLKKGYTSKKILKKLGLYEDKTRSELQRLYGLIWEIKSGRTWKNLYNVEGSTTIEGPIIIDIKMD